MRTQPGLPGSLHRGPLSWASERAMMCSMSVSRMLSNHVPV